MGSKMTRGRKFAALLAPRALRLLLWRRVVMVVLVGLLVLMLVAASVLSVPSVPSVPTAAGMAMGGAARTIAAESSSARARVLALGANLEVNPADADSAVSAVSTAVQASSPVDAGALRLTWASGEPQRGQPRFGSLDQAASAWATQGKNIALIIAFADESGGGYDGGGGDGGGGCQGTGFLPAWEVARIPTLCDRDMNTVIPDYFDATFQRDFLAFVQVVAAHVAASSYASHLLYVRIGVGLAGEGFPLMPCPPGGAPCDAGTSDLSQLVAWGYSPHRWAQWQERMLTRYRALFGFTRVVYPMGDYGTDSVTHRLVDVEVAEWAADRGFALGAQGLAPTPTYSSYAGIGSVVSYVRRHDPQTFIQFQTVHALRQSVTATCDLVCVARGDIANAERLDARSIEWYHEDATNPALSPLLAAWQEHVATASPLRGSGQLAQGLARSTRCADGRLPTTGWSICPPWSRWSH